jgi:hypothetical protein
MLIVLAPALILIAAGGAAWWLRGLLDAVPRSNADFGLV